MDKNKIKNKTLIPKIICLLLSFGLWIYVTNVENPIRTYEVKNIPVELINLDILSNSNFALSDNQQFTVDLKLEGYSNEVLKAKPEDFKIVADMSAYALKLGENTIPVQVIDYPKNINIQNNGFLGIKVNLEELVKKDFTIQSRIKLSYKDNIYELSKNIAPDKVTVTGAKSTVEKINAAIITGEEEGISKNLEKNYDITFIDTKGNEITGVSSNVKSAKLSVEVSNGKSVPINLKISGNPKPGLELKGTELSSNYVNIMGNLATLGNIQSIDTEEVDISNLEASSEINVKLVIPEGVTVKDGQNYIKVKVTLESLQEENKNENVNKTLEIPVNYIGLNDEFDLETSSNKVNVTISGLQSEIDKVTEGSLNAVVDLSKIQEEGSHSYKPDVTFTSPTTAVVSDVGNIEVLIKKKV